MGLPMSPSPMNPMVSGMGDDSATLPWPAQMHRSLDGGAAASIMVGMMRQHVVGAAFLGYLRPLAWDRRRSNSAWPPGPRRCRRRASKSIRCGPSRCRITGSSARPSASRSTRRITSGSFIAPARSKPGEVHATTNPPIAQCCAPAPPVLEFDQAGNLLGHWGGPGKGYDWPDSNHGITVDYKGNVWIGGNGRGGRRPPRAAGADRTGSRTRARSAARSRSTTTWS